LTDGQLFATLTQVSHAMPDFHADFPTPVAIDATDRDILELLQEDARRTVADIAGHVSLSATAVRRRIDRLEQAGVILGYSARIDYAKLGWALEAFTELRFTGETRPDEMDTVASRLPEVEAIYTTAGDHDVLARVRATDVEHLRQVIDRLRASKRVLSSRTHVVLASHVKAPWRPRRDD
jgi:Lrp/AsnC family transcriptional regulator, leucine-responsive regulatory protein